MSDKTPVFKYTLNTGKEIYLREPDMRDDDVAAQKAGARATNQLHSGVAIMKEYAKLILVAVKEEGQEEPKKLSANEKEVLHEIFTPREWRQVQTAIQTLMGGDDFLTLSEPEITSL